MCAFSDVYNYAKLLVNLYLTILESAAFFIFKVDYNCCDYFWFNFNLKKILYSILWIIIQMFECSCKPDEIKNNNP